VASPRASSGAATPEPAAGGVLDEAAERIAAGAARPVPKAALEQAAVDAMLATIADPWSTFYRPAQAAELNSAIEGRYTGVGLWLRPGGPTGVQVGSVHTSSPAADAGVGIGDAVGERRRAPVPARRRGGRCGSATRRGVPPPPGRCASSSGAPAPSAR
jgi:C-terminal processing protease CtpA/Prc